MSIRYMSFAFEAAVSSSEKLVLLALADAANDEGLCWPSLKHLSSKCSMSVDGVARIIVRLEEIGVLKRRKRFGKSTIYKIVNSTKFRQSDSFDPESTQFRSTIECSFDPESKEIYEPSKKHHRNDSCSKPPNLFPEETRFEEWWEIYPRDRRGSKDAARRAYAKALKRAKEDEIHAATRAYRDSDEVARGFAKGAAAWLNDDRWTTNYVACGSGRSAGSGQTGGSSGGRGVRDITAAALRVAARHAAKDKASL